MRATFVAGLLCLLAGCGKPVADSPAQPPTPESKGQVDPVSVAKPPSGTPTPNTPQNSTASEPKRDIEPEVKQTTLDELLADAPKIPLKLTTFSFGGVELTAELPENTRIEPEKTDFSISTKIWFQPDLGVHLDLYVHDLSEIIKDWASYSSTPEKRAMRIWRGPEFQLIETAAAGDKRFYAEMLPSAGPIGMRAFVVGKGVEDARVTRAQALQIFKSLRTVALKKPLPKDPAEQLEELGGTVNKNNAGRVDSVKLTGWKNLAGTGFAFPLLKGVPDVRYIYMHMVYARPNDFAVLADLPNLHSLNIELTAVGDAGLIHIAKCRQLQSLAINSGSISLAGLKVLQGCSQLKTLRLSLSRDFIKTADLPVLSTLPGLKNLEIRNARLTDKDLIPLGQIKDLEELSLYENDQITDAGLTHLSGLAKLKSLNLAGTKVTDSAIADFKKKKPSVDVHK